MVFPSCEIQKDNFRDPQRKQSRTKNEETFESNALKQKQHCVAVTVAIANITGSGVLIAKRVFGCKKFQHSIKSTKGMSLIPLRFLGMADLGRGKRYVKLV